MTKSQDSEINITYETRGDYADICAQRYVQIIFLTELIDGERTDELSESIRYGDGGEVSIIFAEDGTVVLVVADITKKIVREYRYGKEKPTLTIQEWNVASRELVSELNATNTAESVPYFFALHEELQKFVNAKYDATPSGMTEPPNETPR